MATTHRKAEREYLLKAERFRRTNPTLLAWSRRFRREEGQLLDFSAYPFQPEVYRAFGDRGLRTVDVMKSGQCGISAAGVSLALYAPDLWDASVLYVLPTEDLAYKFSDTRVKTAIDDSPYLSSIVTGTDNKGLKRVGRAFAYFVASRSEASALSIPADVLVLDEYDRLDQGNVPKFRKRLGAPTSLKLERRFSNPSWPEAGIHKLYLDTDQREWLIRCGRCNHEAPVEWDRRDGSHFVDEDRGLRRCGGCRRRLGPEAIATGRWVARRPDVAERGYHISKLIVPGEDIPELVKEHRKSDEETIQAHYNFDLGLPYSPKGGALDRDIVLACRRDYRCPTSYDGPDWVTAGVDVGRVLHVRISRHSAAGKVVPLYIGEVQGFTDLAQLWRSYGVNFGLVDERPEERAARAFVNEFKGRAMLLRWSGQEQRDPIVVDSPRDLVVARRTGAFDRLIAQMSKHLRYLPRDLPRGYVEMLTAPHRVTETTKEGQKVARYVSEREDHYFLAEVHDLLAREARGGRAVGVTGQAPKTIREQVRGRR